MAYGLGLAPYCSLRPFQEAITALGALPMPGAAGGVAPGGLRCWWWVIPLVTAPLVPHTVVAQPRGLWEHRPSTGETPSFAGLRGAVDSKSSCLTAKAKLGCASACH